MLWKIFLYIFKKKLFKFSGNWTIICLGKGISRTLEHLELDAYSEPEAYSEHNQASTMERFAKLAIWCTFKPKLKKKNLKNPPQTNFLYFKEWNDLAGRLVKFQEIKLSSCNIKKFLIFSQIKIFSFISRNWTFLYFRKRKHQKKSLYFRKRSFFMFLKTETLKKLFMF